MGKRHQLLGKARRLYIELGHNIPEVANKCDVCEQTIINWKRYDKKENDIDWDKKRKEYIERKRALTDETDEFLHKFIKQAKADMDAGEKLSVGRLYILKDFIPYIQKLQNQADKDALKDIQEDLNFSEGLNELIKSQAAVAVQQLYQEELSGSERVKQLEKLAKIQKDMQKTELQSHLKSLDAKIVSILIRRFRPEATDNEVIKIYKEAVSEAKTKNIKGDGKDKVKKG